MGIHAMYNKSNKSGSVWIQSFIFQSLETEVSVYTNLMFSITCFQMNEDSYHRDLMGK